ncbi:MAG: hypothetical protein IPI24_09630 [Ignavibacteria bacterium]|nr:hypothetical protein [Ignavibacteria bacterium]
MSPLSERPIASHLLHVMVVVSVLLVAAHSAEAQKPKLKLLEYNLPEDWHICAHLDHIMGRIGAEATW